MNQQNKTERWEEKVYKWFHDQDVRIHSDRVQPLLETISQLLSDTRREERERCLEALPKKKEHKTQCVNPYGFCNICIFNEAIDQAISTITNETIDK